MKIENILDFLDTEGIVYVFQGDRSAEVEGFSTLKNYKEGTVTWAKNEKAYAFDFQDKRLVIAQEGLRITAHNVIWTSESKLAFFSLVEYMAEDRLDIESDHEPSIGAGTIISPEVRLGENVKIGCNCVIQGNISIGNNTRIWNNVTIINNVVIGEFCEIQSGSVIGHDGFAWNEDINHNKTMIKHFGGVSIADNVYIGPNCVIDRGEIDYTTVKNGVKIDANCFIAHNVIIGENSILITGSRLYGSSELGDNVYVASATVRNQCKIGKDAFVGIGAVVTKDIPEKVIVAGIPAKVMKEL